MTTKKKPDPNWGGKRENAGSKSPQGGKTTDVSFLLLETTKAQVKAEAAARGMSMSAYLVEIINARTINK